MTATARPRTGQLGWVLLPLRVFLALVYLDGGIAKIADRRFLDGSSPSSMHATVEAVRVGTPLGPLLGPVAAHSFAFGLLMAAAELAVGIGLAVGLFTRVAALGGMVLALSLWLTVSWQASPWFTSADVVYLAALSPLAITGAAGVLSADGWLATMRARHPGVGEDRTRRALLTGGAALAALVLAGVGSLVRRPPQSTAQTAQGTTAAGPQILTPVAAVAVGGGVQVSDPVSGDPAWVLQLTKGHFTAYDATCPHNGCPVHFDSAQAGFSCPCHGSRFDSAGQRLSGPATRSLTTIPVTLDGADVTRA